MHQDMMNRIGNAANPYQGRARKVLCVCSAGLLRSPTAANVLHAEYGFNTRACGVFSEFALIPLDEALIYWADEIVFVQPSTLAAAIERFPKLRDDPGCVLTTLNIPDEHEWNAPELRAAIKHQYEEHRGVD